MSTKTSSELPAGATLAPTPSDGDPSIRYYYTKESLPDNRAIAIGELFENSPTFHKPVGDRKRQTWAEVCNDRISVPPPQPKGSCVLTSSSVSQKPINTDYTQFEKPAHWGSVEVRETVTYQMNGTQQKGLYEHMARQGDFQQQYAGLGGSAMAENFSRLATQQSGNQSILEQWNPQALFARGLSKNWHQTQRRDPVAPTKYQNPRTLSFNEIDLESHLLLHCPLQKYAFDTRFVTKVLLPGGNLRKCYVKVDWDKEIITFQRKCQSRFYPLKYLTEANDSPAVLNHMILTGALSDLLEIDKRNFCSLFMSNLQHPLLLVFGSLRKKEYFVSLCQHIIEYCNSKDFLFYNTGTVKSTKTKLIDERRNAVMTLPLLEIFKKELTELKALEIEQQFEEGVQATVLTGKQLSKGCTIKFEPKVAKLSITHATGKFQYFPLEHITALEVEGDALLALGDDTAAAQAEEFFEDIGKNGEGSVNGPLGFARSETIRKVATHVDGQAFPTTSFTRSPTRKIGETTQSGFRQEASKSIRSPTVQGSKEFSHSVSTLQRLRTDPHLQRLTSGVLDDIKGACTPTFVALTIKGCASPLVLIFDLPEDRDHFIILVQVLQVIFLFPLADTDESLAFKREEEKFIEVKDEEFDEKLKHEDIDDETQETVTDADRHLAGETGVQYRYLRPPKSRVAGGTDKSKGGDDSASMASAQSASLSDGSSSAAPK
eukprot:GHVN01004327.1.p1 GENE.GHVN01004327.1~~GHVN01004327.1.p1  ORF type:complete len:716 (-),score=101.90 GHVN01004327.1:777-2924(-)